MATATATTYPTSYHNDVGHAHIPIQTSSLPSNQGSYSESPTTASKPFEMVNETQNRLQNVQKTSEQAATDNSSIHSDGSVKSSSRPSSPFLGADRRSLFGQPTSRSGSPLVQESYHRGQFLEKSDSDTLSRLRPRSRSFTEKAVDTLAAPISLPLVLTCGAWYMSSVVSNTLNKTILTVFPYPVTLTMIQFLMAVSLGLSTIQLSMSSHSFYKLLPAGTVSHSGFRYPTREIIMSTLPMGIFQLFGHIFSHMATSLIPVSLVHTIKALSPLFTVGAYRFVFGVKYPLRTYLTLIPLTSGVILTCSTQFSSQMRGIIYALIGSLIFVSQNIYSKKLLTYRPENSAISDDNTPRIDKLNILCYCSSLAFIFTSPLWLFSEGFRFILDYFHGTGPLFGPVASGTEAAAQVSLSFIAIAFFMNGISHFLQNILAFQILGMVSPVTYSVASLIKRISVVTVSIIWFGQKVSGMQQFGIVMTFGGLYIYDRMGGDKTKQKKYANISLNQGSTLPK